MSKDYNLWTKIEDNLILKKFTSNKIIQIKKAWEFAALKHAKQFRKNGDCYTVHLAETACYLIQWDMDVETIISGILHDVIEDTNTTLEEIKKKFGETITKMVSFVTKVSFISAQNRKNDKKNYDHKLYIDNLMNSISDDIRIITIKLADRLHNMNTIEYLDIDKQKRIAQETLDIYAAIAGRIGMYDIKTLLMDLSFKVLMRDKYDEIEQRIVNLAKANDSKWNQLINTIKNVLILNNINFKISSRLKGIYSTYLKLLKKKVDLKEITDILATRIIIDGSLIDCYKVLGLIHLNFRYLPNSFKDYISSPKLNLYQSIHTVLVYEGIYVEIQIRNKEMEYICNYGIAAHWKYKEKHNNKNDLIKNILFYDYTNKHAQVKLDKPKYITKNKIFEVLVVNDNKWYIVNELTTVLDLAFKVNATMFPFVSSFIINENEVSFNKFLTAGDVCRINYADAITLNNSWKNYLSIPDAIEKVNLILKSVDQNNQNLITAFFENTQTFLKDNFIGKEAAKNLIISLGFNSIIDFLDYIKKNNKIKIDNVYAMFLKNKKISKQNYAKILKEINDFSISNDFYFEKLAGIYYKKIIYPNCCSKIPGIDCIGKINKSVLEVHSYNCSKNVKSRKYIVLKWNYEKLKESKKQFVCMISFICNAKEGNKIVNLIFSLGSEMTLFQRISYDKPLYKFIISFTCFNLTHAKEIIYEIESKFIIENMKII